MQERIYHKLYPHGELRDIVGGDPVTLNGSGVDPEDGTNVTFEWSVPPEINDLSDSALADPSFTAPNVGSTAQVFTLSLIVRDTQGVPSIADTVNVTVNPINLPPIADAGEDITTVTIETDGGPEEQDVMEGTSVQLDGSGEDPEDGTNVTYEWTVPAGIVLDDNTLANPTFTAPAVGDTTQVFTLSLIVRDPQDVPSIADTVEVTVFPTPPFAFAGFDQNVIYPTS